MSTKCPYCKKSISKKTIGVWPFCSERCKNLDLANWTREDYRIPGEESKEESGSSDPSTSDET